MIPVVNAVSFNLVDKGDYVALMVNNPENLGSSDIIVGYDDSLKVERVEKGSDFGGMFKSNVGEGMVSIVFVDTNGLKKDGEVAKIYYKGYGNMSVIFSDAYDAENHVELEVENGNLEIKGKGYSGEESKGSWNYILIIVVVLLALAVVYFVLRKYRGSKDSVKEEKDSKKKEEKGKEENKGKKKSKK